MPRRSGAANSTFFHFRVDVWNDAGAKVRSKYYHTAKQFCEDYGTSSFTMYKMIADKTYRHTSNLLLQNITIERDKRASVLSVQYPTDVAY